MINMFYLYACGVALLSFRKPHYHLSTFPRKILPRHKNEVSYEDKKKSQMLIIPSL